MAIVHEALMEQAVSELVNIYDTAQAKILGTLKNADLFNSSTKPRTLQQIRSILLGLKPKTQGVIEEYTDLEWSSGISSVDSAMKGVNIGGGFNVVDKNVFKLIAGLSEIKEGAVAELNTTLSNAYANIESTLSLVSKQVRRELISEIGNRAVIGEARTKIAKALIDKLEKNGITGLSYNNKNGVKVDLKMSTVIDGLVRNTLITSHANSTITRALELGQDLVKISTHGDPSWMCEKWQGQILSITGRTKGYKPLDQATFKNYTLGGVFHRYCRHSLRVYVPTDIKFKVWKETAVEKNKNKGIGAYV
jgi:uncharacterized protein YjgD (DUF1641 family)